MSNKSDLRSVKRKAASKKISKPKSEKDIYIDEPESETPEPVEEPPKDTDPLKVKKRNKIS